MKIEHAEFTIERDYPYSPEQVYSAFAESSLREQWFANAGKFDDAEWRLDFRVGGEEYSAGSSPDRKHHAFRSRFHDITPGERIVFAYDLLINHKLISVSLATYEFIASGDGTHLIFNEQGAFFDKPGDAEMRAEGSEKLVDLLGDFLARHFGEAAVSE